MINAFIFISETLTQSTLVTDEIPAANIYPVLAPADFEGDFMTYDAARGGIVTKDQVAEYDVTLNIYCDNVLEAIEKTAVIEGVLIDQKDIRSRGASVEYTESLERAYVQLKLTLKI
jgi:hypothetical protein